ASTRADFALLSGSSVTAEATQSTLTVSGLTTAQAYYLRVSALNWNGVANFTTVGQATTGAGPAPVNPQIVAVFQTSMSVTWGTVDSGGYSLEASTMSDFTGTLLSSVTADATRATLTLPASLTQDTTYYLRVGSLWSGTTSYAPTS